MNHPDSSGGRRVVVTGANTGIGAATAEILGARGADVVLAGRSADRTRPVIERIRAAGGSAAFLRLDLASLTSVRRAAAALLSDPAPVHVLINNAGIAGRGGVTEDGFEMAFGVNHLGHFLFTTLLLDRIEQSGPSRIVSVTSEMHRDVEGIEWNALRRPARGLGVLDAYRVSKLANVLFVHRLAELLAGSSVTAVAVHPGLVASDIWRRVPGPFRRMMARRMLTPAQGAEAVVFCATSTEIVNGGYYARTRLRPPSSAIGPELASELWDQSMVWTGQK